MAFHDFTRGVLNGASCLYVDAGARVAVRNCRFRGCETTDLQISQRDRHVYIAVRDGSSAEPVLNRHVGLTQRGRGLLLVAAVAQHWGWLPTNDGKVVWASLRE